MAVGFWFFKIRKKMIERRFSCPFSTNSKYPHDENQLVVKSRSAIKRCPNKTFVSTKINYMETSIQHAYAPSYSQTVAKESVWKKFIDWSDRQEENRFGWTAFTIVGHGFAFTIMTVATILLTGNHFIFWPFAIASMTIPLIVNLAALPTKITIPVLFFSVLMDLVIIGLCLANGFDLAASYR
jgi:hypothetical protein